MKSTWFSKPAHHEFAKCLEDVCRGSRHIWNVFSDFLELAYLPFVQAVRKQTTGEICPKIESEYMERIGHYKSERYQRFPEALAIMVNALQKERYDFLGSVAGEMDLLNKWNGQFFTPQCLCDMIARVNIGTPEPGGERLTIIEPACGAGAMAIAVAKYLMDECGFWPRHYYIVAQDIDVKMYMACYIQLTLCGVPAEVRCVNTLGREAPAHREITQVGIMFPHRHSHLLGATWLEPAVPVPSHKADPEKLIDTPPAKPQRARHKTIVLPKARTPKAGDMPGQISFDFDAA